MSYEGFADVEIRKGGGLQTGKDNNEPDSKLGFEPPIETKKLLAS